MKRILVSFVALLMLAGCGTIGEIATGSTANPVTPTTAAILHASFIAGVLNPSDFYSNLPRCSHHAPPCSSQIVVNGMRKYLNPANAALERLDDWAQGNQSINGAALYQAAKDAIAAAKDFGIKNHIPGIS